MHAMNSHMTVMGPARDPSHSDAYWSSTRYTRVVVLPWSSKVLARRRDGSWRRRHSLQRRGRQLRECCRHWPGAEGLTTLDTGHCCVLPAGCLCRTPRTTRLEEISRYSTDTLFTVLFKMGLLLSTHIAK